MSDRAPQLTLPPALCRSLGSRRLRIMSQFGRVALLGALAVGFAAASADAAIDSSIAPGESIALPSGHGLYAFVGSTSGEQPMGSISWLGGQDLGVTAAKSGDQAISIGHDVSGVGSYSSSAGSETIAGVGLDGYTVAGSFSAHGQKGAHKAGSHPGKAVKGAGLTLAFKTTEANQLVVILVGAQGTGTLKLSGIPASVLQNATYGAPHSSVIASAAAYTAQLPVGKHKAKWRSTTYAPNSGTSLGAVAYVLSPAPAPAVTGVSPNSGPEAGGTPTTITGTDLDGATSVKFGAADAGSFKVTSPTSIEAISPSGSGNTDVTVTTERGTSATMLADQFSYVPPPAVGSVSPNAGPEAGGTSVTISGTNLAGTTAVQFGAANAASFKVNSPTSIEAVSPSGSGTVQVTVTGPYGTSAITPSDQFTYTPPPPPPPSITASKGGPFHGGFALNIQVHNFPLGTFVYACHDNSGPGGSDTVYFSHAVEVTDPSQGTWPGVFCFDSAPFVSYLVMDGVRSNSVQF
jgi:hypothetical protein